MAILNANFHTLASYRTRENPDGTVATITEILNQQAPAIADLPFTACNSGIQNLTTLRTKVGTATLGRVAGGYTPSRTETAQIIDVTSQIRAMSTVDKDVFELNGNGAAQRAIEARGQIEGLNQTFAETLLYGSNASDPGAFNGLMTRYGAISGAGDLATQIVDAGGTGSDNTSALFVVWGDSTVHGLYPAGMEMGIKHEMANGGNFVTRSLANGNVVQEYQDFWSWHVGLALRDWRSVCRIPNIDVSNLVSESSNADLLKLFIKAKHRIMPVIGMGTPVIYVNRTVAEMLEIQARNAVSTGGQLSYKEVDGKPVTQFQGIPIKVMDRIRENEARVV